jgi:hypothetical protein
MEIDESHSAAVVKLSYIPCSHHSRNSTSTQDDCFIGCTISVLSLVIFVFIFIDNDCSRSSPPARLRAHILSFPPLNIDTHTLTPVHDHHGCSASYRWRWIYIDLRGTIRIKLEVFVCSFLQFLHHAVFEITYLLEL